jgi:hypothetical protein
MSLFFKHSQFRETGKKRMLDNGTQVSKKIDLVRSGIGTMYGYHRIGDVFFIGVGISGRHNIRLRYLKNIMPYALNPATIWPSFLLPWHSGTCLLNSVVCTLVPYIAPSLQYGGFIKGILRGVRCTKSLRVLFLHRRPPSWTTLVLYSRAVFIFNEPAYTLLPFDACLLCSDCGCTRYNGNCVISQQRIMIAT